MATRTIARSISRRVREHLRAGRGEAQVLAVFADACNIITDDGFVIALVSSHVGDGPLNVVIEGAAGRFTKIAPGTPVTLARGWLCLGDLKVDLAAAAEWEPRPDWNALRSRRDAITASLVFLRAFCADHASPGSLLALLGAVPTRDTLARAVFSRAKQAAKALQEGWNGDRERLKEGAAGLAGLGGGLTPAGDDFLAGAMLWAWLAHPSPTAFCQTIAAATMHRSTALSAALLQAAAGGECGAAWHALFGALSEGDESKIIATAKQIIGRGATSGADGLSGFLYFGSDF